MYFPKAPFRNGFILVLSAFIFTLSLFAFEPLPVNAEPMSSHHSPVNLGLNQAMIAMDIAMSDAPMTGKLDIDFATMMIPHHQGAIDMAKVELKYGADPRLPRLAQEIIVTQQSEIALMQLALAHPAPLPSASQ